MIKTLFTFIFLALMTSNNIDRTSSKIDQGLSEWTVRDITGKSYNLHDILKSGRSVMLFFSTTWCSASWEVVETDVLDDINNAYGPKGNDQLVLLFVEADPRTDMDHLRGVSADQDTIGTMGDWLSDHDYPIIDDVSLAKMYGINAFPTTILIPTEGEYTKILGGASLTVENIGQWLSNTAVFAMKSFGSPSECKMRGMAGDINEFVNFNNGESFYPARDQLEAYFEKKYDFKNWKKETEGDFTKYKKCLSSICYSVNYLIDRDNKFWN